MKLSCVNWQKCIRQSGKNTLAKAVFPELYFLRDSQGLEADLVFRANHDKLIPIEIKGGMTWNKDFCKNLLKLQKISPKFDNGYVIYAGELTPEVDGIKFVNFKDTASVLS